MVKTLEQIAEATAFAGFTPEDFAVFEAPDYATRMPLLRERIKPGLAQIGAALPERLSLALHETFYAHVAQHLRRTVNAPQETWVAFARASRAYKPYVHLRAAISADRFRVLAFVEDDADDKLRFAQNLERNAAALALYLLHHPTIQAYDIVDAEGKPLHGHALDAPALRGFAARMQRVKGQHARFGIAFAPSHPILANGPELLDAIVDAAVKLKPIYDCGVFPDWTYTYEPESIAGIPA
jgi:uncharacterized protein YktB (UPF0637 family)